MIPDAGHSLSDLLSDEVTLWALMLGRMPKNDTPISMVDLKPSGPFLLLFSWGLQLKTIGTLFVAVLLGFTALELGIYAIGSVTKDSLLS